MIDRVEKMESRGNCGFLEDSSIFLEHVSYVVIPGVGRGAQPAPGYVEKAPLQTSCADTGDLVSISCVLVLPVPQLPP